MHTDLHKLQHLRQISH